MTTSKEWPANAIPTPEQLAAYLRACNHQERIEACKRLLEHSEASFRCFTENHDGQIGEGNRAFQRLWRARDALKRTGYFEQWQIQEDVAPRITELYAALTAEKSCPCKDAHRCDDECRPYCEADPFEETGS